MNNKNYLLTDEEALNKLKALIASGEDENIKLALTLYENGGQPAVLFTHLLAIWSFYTYEEVQEHAKVLIENHLTTDFEHFWFKNRLYEPLLEFNESEITERLENTFSWDIIDTPTLANLMLQFAGRAGAFCLKYQTDDTYSILQKIYTPHAHSLSFNSYNLETLPSEVGLFVDAERLVLSHNLFTNIPDSLANLTKLQSIELEDTPLTQEAFQKLEKFFPKPMADYYVHLGYEAFDDKKFKQAIHYLDKSLRLNPHEPHYFNTQGINYLCNKDFDQAVAHFEQGMQAGLEPATGLYNIACTFSQKRDKSNMLKYLKESIELDAYFKEQAASDDDFNAYRQDDDFLALIKE
ncbi:MAG TPA: hypothetical protein DCS93_42980 [Microscillaceae bacterium]|nr:hypothetical protein [Microscillaceae bacterium]